MFVFPLWRISLFAPQYPEGLGMLIRLDTVTGIKPNDLPNINSLNHYIGMKPIVPESIPELRYMPWIVATLVLTGVLAALMGRRRGLYAWLGAFTGTALIGLVDFWRWERDYGRDLDLENAIIRIEGMTYQPPLIGSKQLLNFNASSWPDVGALLGALAFLLAATAVVLVVRDARRARRAPSASAIPIERAPVADRVASRAAAAHG